MSALVGDYLIVYVKYMASLVLEACVHSLNISLLYIYIYQQGNRILDKSSVCSL